MTIAIFIIALIYNRLTRGVYSLLFWSCSGGGDDLALQQPTSLFSIWTTHDGLVCFSDRIEWFAVIPLLPMAHQISNNKYGSDDSNRFATCTQSLAACFGGQKMAHCLSHATVSQPQFRFLASK